VRGRRQENDDEQWACSKARPIAISSNLGSENILQLTVQTPNEKYISNNQPRSVRVGSKSAETRCPGHVRFPPGRDQIAEIIISQRRANNRLANDARSRKIVV
jgi:hypothetical protein